jgi:hypothetical protein
MNYCIPMFATAALLLAAGAAQAGPGSEAEVRAYLESEGFEVLGDVDFEVDSGVWEADVLASGGDRIEVHVDPVTGRIVFGDEDPRLSGRPVVVSDPPEAVIIHDPTPDRVIVTDPDPDTVIVQERPDTVLVPVPTPVPPPPALGASDVRVILSDAGFHDVHDIEFSDGRWRAEARDATGEDYELAIDPIDGRIVHLEDD